MRKYLFFAIAFVIFNISYADQWMIEDFEGVNTQLSPNWTIQWYPLGLSLRTGYAYEGVYAAILHAPSMSGTSVSASNPIDIQFSDSICNYNLSFWYNLTGKIDFGDSFSHYLLLSLSYDWTSGDDGDDYYDFYVSNNQTFINDSQWHKMTFPIGHFEYIDCLNTKVDWLSMTHDNFVMANKIDLSIDNLMIENYTEPPPEQCTESWDCTDWSSCVSGVQTRSCNDAAMCGTTTNKPGESRQCISITLTPSISADGMEITVDTTASSNNGVEWVTAGITLPNGTVVTKSMDLISGTTLSGQYRTVYASPLCGTHHISINGYDGVNTEIITRNIDISQTLSATLNLDKAAYTKTETIRATGTMSDTADVQLRIANQLFSLNNTTSFSFSYTIPQTDLAGDWNATLVATGACDSTTLQKTITVTDPNILETYNVVFTSPDEGTPYQRGETVTIAAQVKQEGVNVQGAQVLAYIGNYIATLSETIPGNYRIDYTIPYDAPTGTVPVYVRAEKGDRGGTSSVDIYVQPVTLNVAVSSPERMVIGTGYMIQVNVSYPDWTPAGGLEISIRFPNGTLEFIEVEQGIYEAAYTPVSLGVWNMRVSTKDGYGNIVSSTSSVQITEPQGSDILSQYLGLLIRYWYFVVAGLIVVVAVGYPLAKRKGRAEHHKELLEEKDEIAKLQKDLQRAYFKDGEVDRVTFEKKSAEYEEKSRNVNEEILKEKGEQKKEKPKKEQKKEEPKKKQHKPEKKESRFSFKRKAKKVEKREISPKKKPKKPRYGRGGLHKIEI